MRQLTGTDFEVFPLCLGANPFGWTADRAATFAVLDAYADAGGNLIDTADVYSRWAPGNRGGESETLIGEWLHSRRNRDEMVLATKVGFCFEPGLSASNIAVAVEASLRRLRTDRIDLYYAHRDDERTPLPETLEAFDVLVKEGKVRYLAASNFTPTRLSAALDVAERDGRTGYVAVSDRYSLVERDYEHEHAGVVADRGLGSLPYAGLAGGFLSGKYRSGRTISGPRAKTAAAYLDDRGTAVLHALDTIAEERQLPIPTVALAWVAAQPTVVAPIASARSRAQLEALLPMAHLRLTDAELQHLTTASEPAA